MIKLSIAAGYVPGFHWFHHIGTEHLAELIASDHPFLEYCQIANGLFKDVPLGDKHMGWVSPSGVDVEATYRSDNGETLNCVMDDILNILYWINDTVGTNDFHHSNIEICFKHCVASWRGLGLDLAEFQLMMIVQIHCLAGIMVKGHKDLHNLVYPVSSLGAAQQLVHLEAHGRPTVLNMILKENDIKQYGLNGAEGGLCEISVNRVGQMFQYVFPQQCLLLIRKEGKHMLKQYMSYIWETFLGTLCHGTLGVIMRCCTRLSIHWSNHFLFLLPLTVPWIRVSATVPLVDWEGGKAHVEVVHEWHLGDFWVCRVTELSVW